MLYSSNYKKEIEGRLDLKPKSAGKQIRILCPFHADSDPSLFINFSKRSWYCFGCEKGGNLNFLLKKLGIISNYKSGTYVEVGRNKKIKVEKVNQEIRDYFTKVRKFDEVSYRRILKEFEIKRTWLGSTAIYFPVWDFEGKYIGNLRRKLTEKQYYLSKGFKGERYMYGEWLNKEPDYMILVEGVFDLFKVWVSGYNCLAVLGLSGDALKLARIVSNNAKSIRKIILFFDSDVPEKVFDEWSYYGENFGLEMLRAKIDKGDPGDMKIVEIKELLNKFTELCT
jgi:DNA primase